MITNDDVIYKIFAISPRKIKKICFLVWEIFSCSVWWGENSLKIFWVSFFDDDGVDDCGEGVEQWEKYFLLTMWWNFFFGEIYDDKFSLFECKIIGKLKWDGNFLGKLRAKPLNLRKLCKLLDGKLFGKFSMKTFRKIFSEELSENF